MYESIFIIIFCIHKCACHFFLIYACTSVFWLNSCSMVDKDDIIASLLAWWYIYWFLVLKLLGFYVKLTSEILKKCYIKEWFCDICLTCWQEKAGGVSGVIY